MKISEKDYQLLQEYKGKDEKGLLFHLPVPLYTFVYLVGCKCGDCCDLGVDTCGAEQLDIYCCFEGGKYEIRESVMLLHMMNDFGKRIFLTKEEAENKMKELQDEERNATPQK